MEWFIACTLVIIILLLAFLLILFYKQYIQMATHNYLTNYHFMVEWGGARLEFTEVSGLDIQIEAISYKSGNTPKQGPQKIPGQTKYSNVILKRPILQGDNEFIEWFNTKSNETVERRDVNIKLLNANHEPVVTWRLSNAFPVRYSGPSLKADGNEVAIEELELTHEGLTVLD